MNQIKNTVARYLTETKEFLAELIRYPSISGKGEEEIQEMIAERFSQFGQVEKLPIPEELKKDPEYTFAGIELDYTRRRNVVLHYPASGDGHSLILNSHCDVVDAPDWPEAFTPRIEDNLIYGRGACDAKGHLAAIYLALLTLKELKVELKGRLQVQSVIEEEVGGNGSLAILRQGYCAEAAVVLESTEMKIMAANRGAVWFAFEVEGRSVHMGKSYQGVNAIEKACIFVKAMRDYEQRLIAESRNVPLFEKYTQPVQVNFGTIHGEGWPSMVCGRVILEGGVGFLPNKSLAQVKEEVKAVARNCSDQWLVDHHQLTFNKLHNDAYAIDPAHPLVKTLEKAVSDSGLPAEVSGFIVSCDARLFNRVGGMPVVVFGPGSISNAHSRTENIDLKEIALAAEVLVRTIAAWCGVKSSLPGV
ncbi:MAG: ArgE/DapE family deacylase [Candidatus Omnitrophica bacterium]|nr:ArgE/DapE family deacylase [Candidatus Omnitrophota bacterium]